MELIDNELKEEIVKSFKTLFDHDLAIESFSLQPTRKEFAGTHTMVMFPYAKQTKKSPEDSGTALGNYLKEKSSLVADFNVVKGFLNLIISDEHWLKALSTIVAEPNFGQLSPNGQKVMVEFSSPNTNKPLHLGHLRNNFLGDSLSKILNAAGYDVMKVNLVNDRGIHICKSMIAYDRYGNGETPDSSGLKGDHLIGKYYVLFDKEYKEEIAQLVADGMEEEQAKKKAPVMLAAQEMLLKWEEGDKQVVDLWKKLNGWVYDGFNATYETMGITFDKVYYESEIWFKKD
jgi:arginyl-tRNA synthetase